MTALGTGSGVKSDPDGVHALQVDYLQAAQAEVLHISQRLSPAEPVPLSDGQPDEQMGFRGGVLVLGRSMISPWISRSRAFTRS